MEDIYNTLFNVATGNQAKHSNFINENTIKQIEYHRVIDPLLKYEPHLKINNNNWTSLSQTKEKRLKELKRIVYEFNKKNIPFMVIKGLSMTKYYPSNVERQSNDFDFLLNNLNDYWDCHNVLKKLGYQQTLNPMFTKHNGKVKGIIKYIKQIDSTTDIKLEFNLGGFIISEVTWLDSYPIWESREKHSFDGIDFYIPNDTMNMVILIIEASERYKFFIRDLVDFNYLNIQGNIDWKYINKLLKNPHLQLVIKTLFKNREAITKGSFRHVNKKMKGVKKELLHVLPYLLRENNTFKKIYLRYLKLIGDKLTFNNYLLGTVRKFDKIMSPKTRFENGIISHFVLFNPKVKGDCKWIKYKNYYLVKTPIGTFWATNFAILEEYEEKDIREFIKKELTINERSFFKEPG